MSGPGKSKQYGPPPGGIQARSAEEQIYLLSCALESLRDAVYITDTDHNIIYVNKAIETTQGYRREEVLGTKAHDLFEGVPGNPPNLARMIEREAENGFWIGEVYNRRKDGTVFPVQLIENTIYGADEEVIGYIGISRDISEAHKARSRLAESEEKYRILTEHSLTGIYIVNPEGEIIYVNKRFEEISGYITEELKGTNIFRMIHPDDLERVKEMSARRAYGMPVEEYWTCRALRKDGNVAWIEVRSLRIIYNGRPAILGNFFEITERHQATAALRESEERLRTLINSTPYIICFKDGEGRWLVANDAIVKLFELEGTDYRGKKDSELAECSPLYRKAFLNCEESDELAWRTGGLSRGEEVMPRPDGTERIMDVIKVPIFDPEGGRKGLVVLGRDITESKQSEERLREASKLEAVGTMSLAIAHEFNNILMGISGYAQLANFNPSDRQQVHKSTSTIIRLTRRARTMIRRLNIFGRREKLHPRPIELVEVIDEALALHERELKLSNIRVRKIYEEPSLVMADFAQLEQVIVNLIMNACYAMSAKGSGTLTVQVQCAGDMVEARVSDTGIGIPAEQIPLIFQPFFTTKKAEKRDSIPSLGLGLWVSRQIIEEHKGTISVESSPGKGTTFLVTLPRTTDIPGEKVEPIAPVTQLVGLKGKNILVIDDEEDLLIIFSRYLTGQEMAVATTLTGKEALELCRYVKYDYILMDYVMPGLSGIKLVRKLHEISPESRIILITGKRLPEEIEQELEEFIDEYLCKPIDLGILGETLIRV